MRHTVCLKFVKPVWYRRYCCCTYILESLSPFRVVTSLLMPFTWIYYAEFSFTRETDSKASFVFPIPGLPFFIINNSLEFLTHLFRRNNNRVCDPKARRISRSKRRYQKYKSICLDWNCKIRCSICNLLCRKPSKDSIRKSNEATTSKIGHWGRRSWWYFNTSWCFCSWSYKKCNQQQINKQKHDIWRVKFKVDDCAKVAVHFH